MSLLLLYFFRIRSIPQSSVHLPQKDSNICDFDSSILPLASTNKSTLQDCLRLFSKKEKLTDNNRCYCNHWRAQWNSLKRTENCMLLPVLLIYQNWFSYNGRQKLKPDICGLAFRKILISHSIYWFKEQLKKNLFSVCNHYSKTDGGHYTTYCKNRNKTAQSFCYPHISAASVLFYTSMGTRAMDVFA